MSSLEPIDARRTHASSEVSGGRYGTAEPERVESGRWQVANKRTIVAILCWVNLPSSLPWPGALSWQFLCAQFITAYRMEVGMIRSYVCLFATLVLVGCGGRVFTNLGNDVAVPSETIDALTRERGITRAEARALLREESDKQRIAEHAETYGVSLDEAKEQLEHAGKQRQQREIKGQPTVPD